MKQLRAIFHARELQITLHFVHSTDRTQYYENIASGHAGAASNAQCAHMYALAYAFLREQLFSDDWDGRLRVLRSPAHSSSESSSQSSAQCS